MIQGKNIILRKTKESDLDELYTLMSDLSEKGEYWPTGIPTQSSVRKKFQETGFWQRDSGEMVITDKNGRIIGIIAFLKGLPYQEGYEIAYQLFRREDRGKGYMTEAVKIFTAYLFSLSPIIRLQINMAKGNIASRKVAEKCGFKYEGTMRKVMFSHGSYHDVELLSILREECPTLSEVL